MAAASNSLPGLAWPACAASIIVVVVTVPEVAAPRYTCRASALGSSHGKTCLPFLVRLIAGPRWVAWDRPGGSFSGSSTGHGVGRLRQWHSVTLYPVFSIFYLVVLSL